MGGPIDLTPFGALVKAIGLLYWLLAAVGLWWALRGTRPLKAKLLRVLPVLLLFGYVPGRLGWQEYQARDRLNKAMVRFEERCKTAGEKIHRTVPNVEGVVLVDKTPR